MKYMNKPSKLILLCPFVLLIKEIQLYCPQRCAYMEPNQSFTTYSNHSPILFNSPSDWTTKESSDRGKNLHKIWRMFNRE